MTHISDKEIDARRFTICMLITIILLATSKALGTYTGVQAAVYALPTLGGLLIMLGAGWNEWRWSAGMALLVLLVSGLVANAITDPTWDGNMYHKVAIVALHDGWSPWTFPDFGDWVKTRGEIYYSTAVWRGNENANWISHYPNFSWLLGSSLMDFGFGWESGKALNFCLGISLYWYSRPVLKQYLETRWVMELAALLVVLCPPLVVQLATNYVDGATYAVATLCVLCLLDKHRGAATNIIAFAALIILAGLKFTGSLYAAMLAVPFLVLRRPSLKEIGIWALVGAIALAHPYLNHVVSGLDIAYPVTGNDKVLRNQAELSLLRKSRPMALADSVFAKTSNTFANPGHKIPGSIHSGEVVASGIPDARFAGFGPLFSLALLAGIGSLVQALIMRKKEHPASRDRRLLLGSAAFMLLMTFVHAAPWWARYVPFFYFGLVLTFVLAMSSGAKAARVLAMSGLVVLLINGCIVLWGAGLYSIDHSIRPGIAVDRRVAKQHGRDEALVIRAPQFVAFSALYHFQHSLQVHSLKYHPVELGDLNCGDAQDLGFWIDLVRVCKAPAPFDEMGAARSEL